MPKEIKFGTSGWREIVAGGIHVSQHSAGGDGDSEIRCVAEPGPQVLVGRDPRFLGEMLC